MKHLPAFKAALAAAAGIIIGKDCAALQPLFLWVAIVLLVVLTGWFVLSRGKVTGAVVAGTYAALSAAFAFYMTTGLASVNPASLSLYNYFAATVEEAPRDTSINSVLLADCYGYDNGWSKIGGRLVLTADAGAKLRTGDRIAFKGTVGNVSEARNPGQFNLKSYYALNGIVGRVYLKKNGWILYVSHDNRTDLQRDFVEPVRDFVRDKIRTFMTGDEAELGRAMLIGERMGISRTIRERFVNSGTVHILAVSGLHVGFFTALLMIVASLLRIPRRFRFFLIAPCLIFYALVVGATPSITRAVLMALVVLFGLFLQRRSHILNSLGFAALAILAVSPAQLFSPGFQLSFCAVLSIAFFYERIVSMVRGRHPALVERPLLNSVVSLAVLTAAATLGTVPLTVYYFNRVSLVGILANLLTVPLAGLFAMMSFTFVFMSLFSSPLASIYGAAAQMLGFSILQVNSVLGSIGVSNARIADPGPVFVLLYFIWLVSSASFGREFLWKKLAFAALLGCNILLYSGLVPTKPGAKIFALDVGQGDAVYVELPDGKNMLVDAGMRFGNYDTGERVILPFLERRGVRELSYFVITHLHSDHIGGAMSVLRKLNVRRFIYSDQVSKSGVWKNTLSCVRALGIPSGHALAGMILDSGAVQRIYVLHPNRAYVGEGGRSYRTRLNEGSIVLKVCVGRESILLAGDAEKRVERDLVRFYGPFLASAVCKVGHHGSSTSSTEEFIGAVRPACAVISVGARNRFGHPSADVLERFSRGRITAWRTDSLGAAYIRVWTDTTEVVTWR